MTNSATAQQSRLVAILREGVAVVQMVLFRELRALYAHRYQDKDAAGCAMLAGAVINALFGSENPQARFQQFKRENRAVIEQELIALAGQFPHLQANITDALRVQTLCDHQEGEDSSPVLQHAENIGILLRDRELPLPSTFMIRIRRLGEAHGLTIAPKEISAADDSSMVH